MSRFEDVVEIDASPEHVFSYIGDPRKLPMLDPSASVRLLSGGWTEVGSRHHVTNRRGRSVVDSVHEITRYEMPLLLAERISFGGSIMTIRTEIQGRPGGGSILIVSGDIEWGGSLAHLIARLMFPLANPPSMRRGLARMKKVIEERARAAPDRAEAPPAEGPAS